MFYNRFGTNKYIFNNFICFFRSFLSPFFAFLDIKVENGELQFIVGQRNCKLLAYKGYNFVKNRKSGVKTYWICAKKVYIYFTRHIYIYLYNFKINLYLLQIKLIY